MLVEASRCRARSRVLVQRRQEDGIQRGTDDGGGEQVEDTEPDHAQAQGTPELAVARRIIKVAEVPVLGSGKTDYVAIQRMAETEAKAA